MIITKEMLVENFINLLLEPLREEYEKEETDLSFDSWLWDNMEWLGENIYSLIGEYFGGEIE